MLKKLAMRSLQDKGLVTIYDVKIESESVFIIQEYCPMGGSYRSGALRARRSKPWSGLSKSPVPWFQLPSGGNTHRDLKPTNILFDRNDQPRIGDFGLVLHDSDKADSLGRFQGTPVYMSPEQLLCKASDGRTDIWSLGAMLYELLSGKRPFLGSSPSELQRQVTECPHRNLTQLTNKVRKELSDVCDKCLEKDPANRFANCSDLITALREAVNRRPVARRSDARAMLADLRERQHVTSPEPPARRFVAILSLAIVLGLMLAFRESISDVVNVPIPVPKELEQRIGQVIQKELSEYESRSSGTIDSFEELLLTQNASFGDATC